MRTIRSPCLSPLNSPPTSPSLTPKSLPEAHTVPRPRYLVTSLPPTSLPPTSSYLPCYQRLTQCPH